MRKKCWKRVSDTGIFNAMRLGEPALEGAFCCTVVEDKSILIENGGEVTLLTEDTVLLEKDGKCICIRGSGLRIHELCKGHIGITGRFACIEYRKEDA